MSAELESDVTVTVTTTIHIPSEAIESLILEWVRREYGNGYAELEFNTATHGLLRGATVKVVKTMTE